MASNFLRRLFGQSIKDLELGDLVRHVGFRGVCWVERINDNDTAMICWSEDQHLIAPISSLRRVRAVGHSYDKRG